MKNNLSIRLMRPKIFSALLFGLTVLLSVALLVPGAVTPASAASTWYVSLQGNGQSGASWATAWNELNKINWSVVNPGDTILVASGTYQTALMAGKSGTAALPITIQASGGQVTIFGGRSTPLPYCDQASYVDQSAQARPYGIDFNGQSYITVDGKAWRGFVAYGHNRDGARLNGSHNTLRYVELYDNGEANHPATGYRSDQPGVLISGTDLVVDHDLIHDNGQDAFQGSGAVGNVSITNSWLYNGRAHPSNPSLAFNYCMHSDGFQVYTGGTQTNLSVTGSILGPGLMQGTILGQQGTPGAVVNNVTLSNDLILDTTNANIMGYPSIKETGWHIDRVTSFHSSYDPDGGSHWALFLEGAGQSLSNSIFYGGSVYTPDGLNVSGNIQFNLTGNVGTTQDPAFAHAPAYGSQPTLAGLIAGDYSSPSGKGSSVTSVSALLGSAPTPLPTSLPAATNTAVPPTRTATPVSTATPVRTAMPSATVNPTQGSQPLTLNLGQSVVVSGSGCTLQVVSTTPTVVVRCQ